MVSKANIAFLRARKARYLVGTPKQLAGVKSVDVLLPVLRGGVRTELRLRVGSSRPNRRWPARSPRPASAKRPTPDRECSAENRREISVSFCTATQASGQLTNSGWGVADEMKFQRKKRDTTCFAHGATFP
jgi:hypothetical protein